MNFVVLLLLKLRPEIFEELEIVFSYNPSDVAPPLMKKVASSPKRDCFIPYPKLFTLCVLVHAYCAQ